MQTYDINLYGALLSFFSGFSISIGLSLFVEGTWLEIKDVIRRSIGFGLFVLGIYALVPGSIRRMWI